MAKRSREESSVSSHTDDDDDDDDDVDSDTNIRTPSVEPQAMHTPKYASLEPPATSISPSTSTTMRCTLPPHQPQTFPTYAAYESHYHQAHINRCTRCFKNFPTPHLLDLHIAENHDPFLAAKRAEAGAGGEGEKTYACFVEGCEKVCSGWKKRRAHLVDKHGFPRNYDFLVVDRGIDGRGSLLRPGVDARGHRKSSRERGRRKGRSSSSDSEISGGTARSAEDTTEATSVGEVDGVDGSETLKADGRVVDAGKREEVAAAALSSSSSSSLQKASVDDLTSSMSALKMVPRSITFGQKKGRSGFAKS